MESKKKLLFVGHYYHQKTRSADFIISLLKKRYDVTTLYVDPNNVNNFASVGGQRFDVLVVWQVMISIDELKRCCDWCHGVYFPMYDNYVTDNGLLCPLWQQFTHFKIINFCKAQHEELEANGFDSEYIQYFPKPKKPENWGDEKSVFFWQRVKRLNLETVYKALCSCDIHSIHIHKALDPGNRFTPIQKLPAKVKSFYKRLSVTESEWYEKEEDLNDELLKHSLYMCPRHYEGIGMSFLDAMAQGRCVIVPNNPTMNEYIENGVNGILYDSWNTRAEGYSVDDIHRMQQGAYESIQKGYERWKEESRSILDWVEMTPSPDETKIQQCSNCFGWSYSKGNLDMALLSRDRRKAIFYSLRLLICCNRETLYHFLLISFTKKFDKEYYLTLYPAARGALPAAAHYMLEGWKKGYNPSSAFSTNKYLEKNPDVRNVGICPLLHWELVGKKECRMRW